MVLLGPTLMAGPLDKSAIRGIYVSDETMHQHHHVLLEPMLTRAKEVGINLLVVDLNRVSPLYAKNLELLKGFGIPFIVRIAIFPGGAQPNAIRGEGAHWHKKINLVDEAARLGAGQIQLDYIRYAASQVPSPHNVEDVLEVVRAFKERALLHALPLQAAVFGVTSFKPVTSIGQNLPLFAEVVDAICPMVYPSHYEPYVEHSKHPYQTIATSLAALREQFGNQALKFKLVPYIEAYNYRYYLGSEQRRKYIAAEIQATQDQNSDGFIVWSANNRYSYLFDVLAKSDRYFSEENKKIVMVREDKPGEKKIAAEERAATPDTDLLPTAATVQPAEVIPAPTPEVAQPAEVIPAPIPEVAPPSSPSSSSSPSS